jgi:hypothetical protein
MSKLKSLSDPNITSHKIVTPCSGKKERTETDAGWGEDEGRIEKKEFLKSFIVWNIMS